MKSVWRIVAIALITGLMLAGLEVPALADWPATGARVAPAGSSWEYPFTIASDGAGGVYVCWWSSTLYGSRLTREGELAPGWPAEALRFGGSPSANILNLPDGAGGMFVVFNAKNCDAHCGSDPAERRVLRLTDGGALSEGWPERGFPVGGGYGPVGTGSGDIGRTAAITDGAGGLIVAWGRHIGRSRNDPVELRVQRMDGRGTRLWGDSGRVVRTATLVFPWQVVAPDERGGAILVWLDERAPHLFGQRVTPDGAPQWEANGIPLACDTIVTFTRPVVVQDGSRGAIVCWFGAVARDTGIFAIRVTGGGGLPWHEPVLVQPASSGIDWLQVIPAGNGDAILAWRDTRTAGGETIHAQRLSHGGRVEWGTGGLPVCAAPGRKDYLTLASDDRGGAYLAWGDTRPAGEVFATHLDPAGNTVLGWDADGTPICPPVAGVWAVDVVNDGEGNAIVAWTDERIPTSGNPRRVTQAMRLLPHGPAMREDRSRSVGRLPHVKRWAASGRTTPVFGLVGLRTVPGAPGGFIDLVLPDAAPSTLELYDVAGRRVWSRDVGELGAGEHAIRLADGAWLPQGVYLARLVRDGDAVTARIAIVR